MKKICIHILFFLFVGSAFAQDLVRMVYFENFAPFSWKENGQMRGIYVDIINETIGQEKGIKVTHGGYPWKRAQIMVEKKRADAFITMPTARRKTYTIVSREPVHIFDIILYTHKKSRVISELKGVKILKDLEKFHTVNYLGNGWAKENLGQMDLDWVPTLDDALTLLSRNLYDVFVGTSQTVQCHIKRLGYQGQIIEIPIIVDSIPIHLCIGKNSVFADILPEFDKKMRVLRDSGQLQKIYAKYQ